MMMIRFIMEFQEVIRTRQSVRAYQKKPVEPAKLNAVLSAATHAPSASNLQAFQIYVARDPATKDRLALAAMGQEFAAQAPIILVFCADLARAKGYGHVVEQNYSPQDTIIAMAYAQLAAVDQGLASCWIGAFDERQVAEALSLPDTLRPVALTPLGYAAEAPEPLPRRPLAELVVDKAG
jgi:nitroreductase